MNAGAAIDNMLSNSPMSLTLLACGLAVWATRARAGWAGSTAAVTLFTLLAAHVSTGITLPLLNLACFKRPPAEAWAWSFAYQLVSVARHAATAAGLLVLARCAVANRGPGDTPPAP